MLKSVFKMILNIRTDYEYPHEYPSTSIAWQTMHWSIIPEIPGLILIGASYQTLDGKEFLAPPVVRFGTHTSWTRYHIVILT